MTAADNAAYITDTVVICKLWVYIPVYSARKVALINSAEVLARYTACEEEALYAALKARSYNICVFTVCASYSAYCT